MQKPSSSPDTAGGVCRPPYLRKPEWLKVKLPGTPGGSATCVGRLVNGHGLHTICSSGMCPNRGECWDRGTATFMIGGDRCTRACRFCNVATGRPLPLDPREIDDIVRSVRELGLRHVVITSVDRDDLPDGGAAHWAALVRALRRECPGVTMETLVPDFKGKPGALQQVIDERPDIISHNLETVRRLSPQVRSVADYDTSLQVIRTIADAGIRPKSGIMLGLGETPEEVLQTMDDLLAAGCQVMTIGQYLQPTPDNWPVQEYVHPSQFAFYAEEGRRRGFRHIESAPLVRSSYHAEKHIL